jgi:hypothetical protein
MQRADRIAGFGTSEPSRTGLPGLALMGGALVVALIALLFTSGAFDSYSNLYLIPWLVGLGIVMATPLAYMYRRGRFTFVDPLIFATLSYFIPAFVVGGLSFAVGLSNPHYFGLVQDPAYNLPLTIVLVGLGHAGFSLGYLSPIGTSGGRQLSGWLPSFDFSPESLIAPGLMLLLLGIGNTIIAFILGRFGYQRLAEYTNYDGLLFFLTLFWVQGSFILWYAIFKRNRLDFFTIPLVAVLLVTSLTKFLYSGSRGNIIQMFLIITFAFILSGRRFTIKQGTIAGILLTLGLMVGMIYGTMFRNVKGTEEVQNADQYTRNIFDTLDQVGQADMVDMLAFGASNFAERIDILTTLAVVVSNYEQLAPYEEIYGLSDNIWIETTTFLIPRVVWPNKPVVSDPRRYSELYFDFGGNSYAITPVGDLLRNYGIIGIPIGMFVLGVVLRFIYRSLVEGQVPVTWRLVFFFMLISTISYEGFYGTIMPVMFRVAVTAFIGIFCMWIIARQFETGRGNAAQIR